MGGAFFLARCNTSSYFAHVMTTQTANGHGVSAVRVTIKKSSDPKWKKWCVFTASFGGVCEWFDTEAKAEKFAESLRNKRAA